MIMLLTSVLASRKHGILEDFFWEVHAVGITVRYIQYAEWD